MPPFSTLNVPKIKSLLERICQQKNINAEEVAHQACPMDTEGAQRDNGLEPSTSSYESLGSINDVTIRPTHLIRKGVNQLTQEHWESALASLSSKIKKNV